MQILVQPIVPPRPWRDLLLFALGPALLAAVVAAMFAARPWPVPHAVQARGFDPLFVGPVLALGALGVWLSSRIGPPSAPSFRDGRAWGRLVVVSVLAGLAMLAISVALDLGMGLSRIAAQAIGQKSVNVPFPASIAHYAFGAVMEECMGHLIPIPILAWLIGGLILRGRYKLMVFWIVAALASFLEPIGQAMALASRAPTLALIVMRLVQELTWHVVWPLVEGTA